MALIVRSKSNCSVTPGCSTPETEPQRGCNDGFLIRRPARQYLLSIMWGDKSSPRSTPEPTPAGNGTPELVRTQAAMVSLRSPFRVKVSQVFMKLFSNTDCILWNSNFSPSMQSYDPNCHNNIIDRTE